MVPFGVFRDFPPLPVVLFKCVLYKVETLLSFLEFFHFTESDEQTQRFEADDSRISINTAPD
jgi:hypothetical protein